MADTDRIGETLRKRVLQDGIDFLGQEGRVNGILADMFPDLKRNADGSEWQWKAEQEESSAKLHPVIMKMKNKTCIKR